MICFFRLFLVDFGLAHSEEFGDVDERWEKKFHSFDEQANVVSDNVSLQFVIIVTYTNYILTM